MRITPIERLGCKLLNLQGFHSRYEATSVGRLHVLEAQGAGTLPPFIVLHGLAANASAYGVLLRHLVPHTRKVFAPDLPGHGFSALSVEMEPDVLERGVFELLDSLTQAGPCILLGNSMGGFVASRYAATRPSRVASLILVSPGGAPLDQVELDRLVNRFRVTRHHQALHFIDQVFAKRPSPLARHTLALGLRARFRDPGLKALVECIGPDVMLRPDELASIQAPALLLWGREERLLPPQVLDFFVQNLPPDALIERWHRFGHIGCLEQAPAVAKRAVQFSFERLEGRVPGRSARPLAAGGTGVASAFSRDANSCTPVVHPQQDSAILAASA